MSEHYILDGKTPIPCGQMEWAEMFSRANRRVALTHVSPDVIVSTVFLGLNHQYGDGPPLIFETLISGGAHDQEMRRYSTWEEAETGHMEMVLLAMTNKNEEA